MTDQLLSERAQEYAAYHHGRVNQLYDDYLPYTFHLNLAAKTASDFRGLVDVLEFDTVLASVYLHDILEDCHGLSYNNLKQEFGVEVAEIVYAVTNLKGRTRAERASPEYYEGIKAVPNAVFVKLADRIANATYGRYIAVTYRLFRMYQKEQAKFEKSLAGEQLDKLVPMLAHLRNVLRG